MARTSKALWRTRIISARHRVESDLRHVEDEALARTAATLAPAGSTVCAYVPVGSEPGSTALLDALVAAGVTVLVPVTREDRRSRGRSIAASLRWSLRVSGSANPPATYFRPRRSATRTRCSYPHSPSTSGACDWAGAPASTTGLSTWPRPMRGSSPSYGTTNLSTELPEDPHDIRMGWALTPGKGLVRLGAGNRAEQHTR